MLCCSECGSKLLYRDGLRYLSDGSTVQRWLCRNCGFRFSERQNSNTMSDNKGKRQICAVIKEAKNLTTAKETTNLAGEIGKQQQDAKGRLVQLMFQLSNDGINEVTIESYVRILKLLLKYGADLTNSESVKETIAKQKRWSESTKALAAIVYGRFADLNRIEWKPPSYKPNRKVPFIPLESELDNLIASCGKKLSALLRLLKETGIRVGEALRLEWKDIDAKNHNIILNNTEKHGVCRVIKISEELLAMLNSIPKKHDTIFGKRALGSWEGSFSLQRRKAAMKLQNPRLLQIHFHTFRHWKATTEYAKTKDILHVMKILGHRSLQNTLLYTQLINFESNDFHSASAKTIEEAKQLIEAGFEYVCEIDNVQLFRKRK